MSRPRFATFVFLVGVIVAFFAYRFPATREAFDALSHAGYAGALIAGMLYGMSFSSPYATVVFAELPGALHPLFVALLGGFGALLYDVSAFVLFRHWSHRKASEIIKAKFSSRVRVPQWLLFVIGGVIIASPFPDELAAGMFGFSSIPIRWFIPFSFFFNTLGILAIVAAF